MVDPQRFRIESYQLESQAFLTPFQQASIGRTFLGPITSVHKPAKLEAKWWEVVDAIRAKHGTGPSGKVNFPSTRFGTAPSTFDIPYFGTNQTFSWEELSNLPDDKLPQDDRQRRMLAEFPKWEDALLFTNDTVWHNSLINAANQQVPTTTINLTTIALLTSTVHGAIDDIADDVGDGVVKGNPLIVMYNAKADTLLNAYDTTDKAYPKTHLANVINDRGGPGSMYVRNRYLGGTFTVGDDGKLTVTADTTNATMLIMSMSKTHQEFFTTNIFPSGGLDHKSNLDIDYVLRSGVLVKDENINVYESVCTIA